MRSNGAFGPTYFEQENDASLAQAVRQLPYPGGEAVVAGSAKLKAGDGIPPMCIVACGYLHRPKGTRSYATHIT